MGRVSGGVSPSRGHDDVIDRVDVVQAMPGDLERAIIASLEAAAASRLYNEQQRQQLLHTNHDSKRFINPPIVRHITSSRANNGYTLTPIVSD